MSITSWVKNIFNKQSKHEIVYTLKNEKGYSELHGILEKYLIDELEIVDESKWNIIGLQYNHNESKVTITVEEFPPTPPPSSKPGVTDGEDQPKPTRASNYEQSM